MDVIWLKVIAFFSFIIVGGVFAVLPWGFQRVESKSRQVIITLADCFAGGVFLGKISTESICRSKSDFKHFLSRISIYCRSIATVNSQ
jgi:hypothetical protein